MIEINDIVRIKRADGSSRLMRLASFGTLRSDGIARVASLDGGIGDIVRESDLIPCE